MIVLERSAWGHPGVQATRQMSSPDICAVRPFVPTIAQVRLEPTAQLRRTCSSDMQVRTHTAPGSPRRRSPLMSDSGGAITAPASEPGSRWFYYSPEALSQRHCGVGSTGSPPSDDEAFIDSLRSVRSSRCARHRRLPPADHDARG